LLTEEPSSTKEGPFGKWVQRTSRPSGPFRPACEDNPGGIKGSSDNILSKKDNKEVADREQAGEEKMASRIRCSHVGAKKSKIRKGAKESVVQARRRRRRKEPRVLLQNNNEEESGSDKGALSIKKHQE